MDVSIDRIRNTIDRLCQFENRTAGTETERDAGNYLKEILSEIGFENIEEHEFPVIAWEAQEAMISLVDDETTFECALFPNSPSAETRAHLIDLDSQLEERVDKLSLYGLAPWGESLEASPNIPYAKAINQGLEGLIISSPKEGEFLKVRVGNLGKELEIPIFSVSKETGDLLRETMQKSSVELDIKSETKRAPSKSRNLEVVLERKYSDFEIVVSAHYDAFFSGAADNAAPVAILLETARLLKQHVDQGNILNRTVRFLLYGAEESGSERFYWWLNGSRNYVENQRSLDRFGLVINLDSIGYEATNYVGTTSDLLDFAESVANVLKQEKRFTLYSPPADGSDHWFFTTRGVPTIYLISWPSDLYHTQKDAPENLDYESIRAFAQYAVKSILEYSNIDVLPLNIFAQLDLVNRRINEYRKADGDQFGLKATSEILENMLKEKEVFEQHVMETRTSGKKEAIAKLNEFLVATAGKINKTIGKMRGLHEANYLASLELLHDFRKIDSAIQVLEDMHIMKISKGIRARLRTMDDVPFNWAEVEKPIDELRAERTRLAALIGDEISHLKNILEGVRNDFKSILT